MKLLVLENQPALARLQCEGEITLPLLTSGATPLLDAVGPDCYRRTVLLDLDRVTFIDSSGIGWLVSNHKRFVEAGGKLILHSIPPMVDQVLRLLKLQMILHLASDEEAARALASGGAK